MPGTGDGLVDQAAERFKGMESKCGSDGILRQSQDLPRKMSDPPVRGNDDKTAVHARTVDALIEGNRRERRSVLKNNWHSRWYKKKEVDTTRGAS